MPQESLMGPLLLNIFLCSLLLVVNTINSDSCVDDNAVYEASRYCRRDFEMSY